MIYLFCSASRPLYKRDALECTCYPSGHLFRFRYEKKYVDPTIWGDPIKIKGQDGIIVFVDTVGKKGHKDFDFFPIRKIKTIRLFTKALAIYIDFKFGDFVNYGPEDDDNQRKSWSDFFKSLSNRPWPPSEKSGRKKEDSEGYFLMANSRGNPTFPVGNGIAHESWENLIRRLNKTKNLRGSTFFQVLGFYKVKRIWSIPKIRLTVPLPFIGSLSEVPLKLKDDSYDSSYSLPMGRSVILKLLFSRPTYADTPKSRRSLDIKWSAETFVLSSKDRIYSESRYNEERIVLVCKRVYDSVVSVISVEQNDKPQDIKAPKPFVLTKIKVPKYIIGVVIVGVAVSTLFIGLDTDAVKVIGSWCLPSQANFFAQYAKVLSSLGKLIATILIGISTYLAFRRLPLK